MPSTAIRDIVYEPDSETLAVTFVSSGRRYRYFGVPLAEYDALRHAFSKGTYFNRAIKPRYEYELLFDPAWGSPRRPSGPNSSTMPKL
ncbi:MAG TPA: KTSC domain-containing protein [Devosia sp.]|nr:KTSC domain-containing protein [Devosia sp.]